MVGVGFQNSVVGLLKRVQVEASSRRCWSLIDVKAVYEDTGHEKDKSLKNETGAAMDQYCKIVKKFKLRPDYV